MPELEIFLSYSHTDGDDACEQLLTKLESLGYRVWRDVKELKGGDVWKDRLRVALRTADVVLVLLTPEAVNSKYVEWEWEQALTLRKRVIPLMMLSCAVPKELEQLHYYDMSQPAKYSQSFEYLLRDLRNLSNRVSSPLYNVWDQLDSGLQDIFLRAAALAHMEGSLVIKTRHFFSVIRSKPDQLERFLSFLPNDALPQPYRGEFLPEALTLGENPQLSGCLEDSLTHLSEKIAGRRQLSTTDVFLDVAKHGTGHSVANLRANGITSELLDILAEQAELNPIRRE